MFHLKENPHTLSAKNLDTKVDNAINQHIANHYETLKKILLDAGANPKEIEQHFTNIKENVRLQLLKAFEDELKKLALQEKSHSSSPRIRHSAHPSNKTREVKVSITHNHDPSLKIT